MSRITVQEVLNKKKRGEKIVMLTAYDYPFARIFDQAGVDMILVGDSLANVVMGLDSTRDVGMEEMIHHAKAVNRAVTNAMVVGDMPFEAYQKNPAEALGHARRFMDAGCDAVKLEWFGGCLDVAATLVKAGIPTIGHVGLTPQTVEALGGFKVQGKDAAGALTIMLNARALEESGCFAMVLECIPAELAEILTEKLAIPTIGIGAGVHCDGQVLVSYDLLGLFDRYQPKFTKKYADLSAVVKDAVLRYREEVHGSAFPAEAQTFHMKPEEFKKLM